MRATVLSGIGRNPSAMGVERVDRGGEVGERRVPVDRHFVRRIAALRIEIRERRQ